MRAHKRNRAVFPAFESCCYRILVILLCLLIYLRNLFVYGCVEKRTLKILKKYQYKMMNNGEDTETLILYEPLVIFPYRSYSHCHLIRIIYLSFLIAH